MAGIYLHVPFCRKACYYCDFYFTTSLRLKSDFITAVKKEINSRRHDLKDEPVDTIYFGGGTPSRLEADEIERILGIIRDSFAVSDNAEITLEANPDDLTALKIREFKRAGVNRLSIGVQSFYDEILTWMNRAHTTQEIFTSISESQQAGITNITIDLIYGVPGLTEDMWQSSIEKFFDLSVTHLSAYSLTVEPKTPLHKLIASGKYIITSDAVAAKHFETLMKLMGEAGWLHYEISNFARESDTISKHNSAYWNNTSYIGLGPSAHSYNNDKRRWNVSPLQKYIDKIMSDEIYYEEESLNKIDKYNEQVLTGLRTMWGVNASELGEFRNYFKENIEKYVKQNMVAVFDEKYVLTGIGKMYADRVASDLFYVSGH
ncbi:MAG: radical SAM family heme chaperone HemW [Bacteroidia bacterium]|nr:radical SAM family heme chaperone HemW [Bacteroidia bacterium]